LEESNCRRNAAFELLEVEGFDGRTQSMPIAVPPGNPSPG
jgi:hypothetical protein